MGTMLEGSCTALGGSSISTRREGGVNAGKRARAVDGSRSSRRRAPSRTTTASLPGDAAEAQSPPPQTFNVPEVESAFISFCQLTSHHAWTVAEAETKRLELLGQVASHVHLPEFDAPDATRQICGSTLLAPLESGTEADKWLDARSIYARLCSTRLLSVAEERAVMLRMHYYRHLAWRILSAESVSQWDLTRAVGLVKAATWHRDLMLQANMRLIVSIVKQLPIDPTWFEELISDGAVALLRAVEKFNPGRGYRFCTYATPAIRRECFLHIKLRRQDPNRYAENAALATLATRRSNFKRLPNPDSTADASVGSDRAHWLAWRERLAGMMSVLTRREQVIIRARYCLGSHRHVKTLQRLADALKISKERVRQLELSALAKLRAAAEMEM